MPCRGRACPARGFPAKGRFPSGCGPHMCGPYILLKVEVNFMWFWWFMLLCDMLVPIVMVIVGRMMWKHCPKHINSLVGYRTTRSMKNMDTWQFAHDYCGKLWWKVGWVTTIASALIHIPLYHSDENTIGIAGLILVAIQCFVMVASIYPTEKALKKHFNDDGTRK